ncbi:MAG: cytochrome c3 family protein [Fidelibacterota bacterium]
MAQIFPQWSNKVPFYLLIAVLISTVGGVGLFWYYGSPRYTDVGYEPEQPVPYSHKLHAGDLGMDCRYCHTTVETSAYAGVPPTNTCMNCHKLVLPASEKLAPVRESFNSGIPLRWVRVHKIPDYTYFDHSIHINAGVGCSSCHGNVREMEVIRQVEPLSMGWCLDCHRHPEQQLRPASEITNTEWTPPEDNSAFASKIIAQKHLNPPEDCSGCHR